MSEKLTKGQALYLGGFSLAHGWPVANPRHAAAPLRRLIHRGLIVQNGMRRGKPLFFITEAGRSALSEHTP